MKLLLKLILSINILCITGACNNSNNNIVVPDDSSSQPFIIPLHFLAERKIKFSDTTPVQVTTKDLSFNNLPKKTFDSLGFKPFTRAPTVTHFNWDSLLDTTFNYNNLPSRSLKFETSILGAPKIIHVGAPMLKHNTGDLIYDLNTESLFTGKIIDQIMQDREGFIWILGEAGLYRYDGTNLILVLSKKFDNDWSLLEDKTGQIWFSSVDEGAFVIDYKHNILNHLLPQSIGATQVRSMLCDENNRLWICSDSGVKIINENRQTFKVFNKQQGLSGDDDVGIFKDKENNVWISADHASVNIVSDKTHTIKYLTLNMSVPFIINEDDEKNIWMGGPNRINVINKQAGTIKSLRDSDIFSNGTVPEFTLNIVHDKNHLSWLGTYPYDEKNNANGICIINLKNNTKKVITAGNGLNSNNSLAIIQDTYGQMWVGTSNGINLLKRAGYDIQRKGDVDISALTEDIHKNIWIATLSDGVEIWNPSTNKFRLINKKNGLDNDTTGDIRLQNGKIFLTTYSGLRVFDSSSKTIQKVVNYNQLNSKSCASAISDNQGRLWITGFFRGIEIADLKKEISYNIDVSPDANDTFVYEIKQDYKGDIWFVTRFNKIGVISQDGLIKYINTGTRQKQYPSAQLCFDEQKNTWISEENVVYKINKDQDSITSFNQKNGLLGSDICGLREYHKRIFVSTSDGLNIINYPSAFNTNKWLIQSFGKNYGFSKLVASQRSDAITSEGTFFWGDKGITVLKDILLSNNVIPETYITGIDIFNQPQYFTNMHGDQIVREDTLWSEDKNKFYLKGQTFNATINANQNKIEIDSIAGPYNMPVNLKLPYDENNIQFHFVEADIGMNDTIWYKYVLQGKDKQWSEKTFNTFSNTYFNLSDGKYIFTVSSLYNNIWSKPAEFGFTIVSPWWKMWWAYVLYALLLAMIYTTIRSLNLNRQNKLLETKVDQRTEQLNKSLEELKSTQALLIQSEKMASLGELTAGIAHEIQNPLNFVNNFSEVNKELLVEMKDEIDKGNIDDAKVIANDVIENEQKINQHGKRADNIVKGMLEHSRVTTGKKEPTDINKLADEYLRLSYHGLRAKDKSFNADFETDFDEIINKINIVPQDIGRVLLNLFNNAFYATNEKQKAESLKQNTVYKPLVTVSTKKINSSLGNEGIEIRVIDNGNGIPLKIIDKIFQPFFTTKPTGEGTGLGLSLSYDIIKAHGGEIKVETKEGERSEFVIQLAAS